MSTKSSNKNQKKQSVFILLALLISFCIGYVVALQKPLRTSSLTTVEPGKEVLDSPTNLSKEQKDVQITYVEEIQNDKEGYGIIEGSLSYPSEHLPEQVVCAGNIETNETFCTRINTSIGKLNSGKGYRLQVPEGFYEVHAALKYYANSAPIPEDKRAYYSDFVVCGFHSGCTSHDPIIFHVSSKEVRFNIDPHDWYNVSN